MKLKLLTLGTLFLLGTASSFAAERKTVNEKKIETKQVEAKKDSAKKWYPNIAVVTSCGLVTYISWDSDWGIDCLMSDAEAADYLTCHD